MASQKKNLGGAFVPASGDKSKYSILVLTGALDNIFTTTYRALGCWLILRYNDGPGKIGSLFCSD